MNASRLEAAVSAYNDGRFASIRACSKAYEVAYSTLRGRLEGAQSRSNAHQGEQLLTPEMEQLLVSWCLSLERDGDPPTHESLRRMAAALSRASAGPGLVGKHWVSRFLHRHPNIHTKQGKSMDHKRLKDINEESIYAWFQDLLVRINNRSIQPANYWNMDEVGTSFCVLGDQSVIGNTDTSSSIKKTPLDREWVTVIECITPSGRQTKPLIIFKAKHVQQQWFIPDHVPDWAYTSSAAAFTTNKIGLLWLQEIFIPEARKDLPDDEWVLLLLDGHKSHVTDDFMHYAFINKVFCYYLIPHASHILQPLDLACFSGLKRAYRSLLAADAFQDDLHIQKQQNFINKYRLAREKAIRQTSCAAGFKAAGILPWDPTKAATSRFVLKKTLQAVQTTPAVTSVTQIKPYDLTQTPTTGRQLSIAVSILAKREASIRDVRTVLAKSGKRIDRLLFDLADQERQNQELRCQLEAYRSKRVRKQPVNPNLKFLSQQDIQMGSHGPPVPILPTGQPIDVPLASSAPQNVRPDVTTAFQAAIASLTGGVGTVRST